MQDYNWGLQFQRARAHDSGAGAAVSYLDPQTGGRERKKERTPWGWNGLVKTQSLLPVTHLLE